MEQNNENFMQKIETNSIKMAVIEYRFPGSFNEWYVHSVFDDKNEVNGGYLNRRCRKLANRHLDCEFRWRAGWLRLDPSDKCTIFKSE